MERPRVGLALGAGAARGMAHLGVLEVLREEQIPIDFVAGTSVGAVAGGIFAAGTNLEWTIRLVTNLDWEHLVSPVVPKMGFVRPDQLLQLIRLLTKGKSFAELEIPFGAVAVDIERGEEVLLREGPLPEAILASASIPGIFVPQQLDGRLLVDGGVLNRVPLDVVRRMGADVVIAVDVGMEETVARVKNVLDVMNQSFEIMQREISKYKAAQPADIFLRPELGRTSGYRLDAAPSMIEAGRVATRAALPAIRQAIEAKAVSGE